MALSTITVVVTVSVTEVLSERVATHKTSYLPAVSALKVKVGVVTLEESVPFTFQEIV